MWKFKHGAALNGRPTPEYVAWGNMRSRCGRPTHPQYSCYGARGITVCDRWQSFTNFLADMGLRPSSEHSIDRIDNDGPYSPENCRWATRPEQFRNTQKTRMLTWGDRELTLREWSRETGIACGTISQRLRRGWAVERTLAQPPQKQGPKGCRPKPPPRGTALTCRRGHPFDEENTKWHYGSRMCRACQRLGANRRYHELVGEPCAVCSKLVLPSEAVISRRTYGWAVCSECREGGKISPPTEATEP